MNVWVGPAKSVKQISHGWALSSAWSFYLFLFFLLSGLREPSTVLLENISPIFSLYFEPTGGVFWWYGGPFLSQQLG